MFGEMHVLKWTFIGGVFGGIRGGVITLSHIVHVLISEQHDVILIIRAQFSLLNHTMMTCDILLLSALRCSALEVIFFMCQVSHNDILEPIAQIKTHRQFPMSIYCYSVHQIYLANTWPFSIHIEFLTLLFHK